MRGEGRKEGGGGLTAECAKAKQGYEEMEQATLMGLVHIFKFWSES